MAAMKISKETPAPRRGIDPPSSFDASPSSLLARSSSPVSATQADTAARRSSSPLVSSSSSNQPGMLPMIFPIPYVRMEESEEEKIKKKQSPAPLEPTSSSSSTSWTTASPRDSKPAVAAAMTRTRIAMDASFISTASLPLPRASSASLEPTPVATSTTTTTGGGSMILAGGSSMILAGGSSMILAGGSSMIKAGGGTSPKAGGAPPPMKHQQMQPKELGEPAPPSSSFLRSSLTTSSGSNTGHKKPRKTVRYAFVQIYEHDLENEVRPDASAKGGVGAERARSYELTEYEAQRGPRRPPKFFQKSDQERQGLRKLRELEELQAEQEWRQIRQETISIQEQVVSFMSAPSGGGNDGDYYDSNQSVMSEASSFANASFYEGFEDRFKVKNKNKKSSLGRRFSRLFSHKRRFTTGGRPTGGANSMIGQL